MRNAAFAITVILLVTASSSARHYTPQTTVFFDPSSDYVFLTNTDGINSLAGEDYGAVRFVAINDNDNSQNLALPPGGFSRYQGVVVGYDVVDESGNGAFCMLSAALPLAEGGPGGSGLPTMLADCMLHFDLAFDVPGRPLVDSLEKAVGFWILEADGDNFETEGILDATRNWQNYSYDLDNLAAHPTYTPGGGIFGDSPVTLLSIQFEDPLAPADLESILYFIDNVSITGASEFSEDFENNCSRQILGDLNTDCKVNSLDFAILAGNWLDTAPNTHHDMVFIPGGTFAMGDIFDEGDSDELPLHTLAIDAFYMNACEITNEQYCDFLNSAKSQGLIALNDGVVCQVGTGYPYCDTHGSDADSQIDYIGNVFNVRIKSGRIMSYDPMVEVSWYGAAAYCNWQSQQEAREPCYDPSTWTCDFSKHGYRLPTEAEWEYAARGARSGKRFPWGDTISHSRANYYSYWVEGSPYFDYDVSQTADHHPAWSDVWPNHLPYTSPVGSFSPNGYGLYDMAGNVFEWCNDWYAEDYYTHGSSNNPNPTGPTAGTSRVLRGGSWNNGSAMNCRIVDREKDDPARLSSSNGFRVVIDLN